MDSIIFTADDTKIVAYLPEEDIVNLKWGQLVTIVGITNEDIAEETGRMGLSIFTMSMEEYIVSNGLVTR